MRGCRQYLVDVWNNTRRKKCVSPKSDTVGVVPAEIGQHQDALTSDATKRETAESLWEEAYENIRKSPENLDLLDKYEEILIKYLKEQSKDAPSDNATVGLAGDNAMRWEMMSLVVRTGLERTETSANIKGHVGNVLNIVLEARDLITAAITVCPPAAAAWSGLSILLEAVAGGFDEGGKNRDNVIYMSSRVKWYGSVADFLLSDDLTTEAIKDQRDQLIELVIGLYEALIVYQAQCICYYDRSQGSAFFRDMLRLDDWDESLAAVLGAEQRIEERLAGNHLMAIRSRLQDIALTAKAQEQLLKEQLNRVAVAAEQQLKVQEHIEIQQRESLSNQREWRQEDMKFRDFKDNKEEQSHYNQLIAKFNMPGLDYLKFMNVNPDKAINTCGWFFDDPQYQEWYAASTGLLVLAASPGQGKSVLARSIVHELKDPETLVCYFFFKNDGEERQKTAANAVCAFLSQLFQEDESLVQAASEQISRGGDGLLVSAGMLWDIFMTTVSAVQGKRVVCIIDALDECPVKERVELQGLLKRHAGSKWPPKMKLFLTSRPTAPVLEFFNKPHTFTPPARIIRLDNDSPSLGKLQQEVDNEINRRIEYLGSIKKWDDQLQHDLKEALKDRGPQQTYLWIRLIFNSLENRSYLPDDQWLEIAKSFPSTAIDIYERFLEQIDEMGRPNVRKLLLIMIAAKRPLDLAEMNIALYISTKRQVPSEQGRGFMSNVEGLRGWLTNNCGFFINIYEGKVQFIHQTASEFLLMRDDTGCKTWQGSVTLESAHREMVEVCLKYLASQDFDEVPLIQLPMNDYAMSFWMAHCMDASHDLHSLIVDESIKELVSPCVERFLHLAAFTGFGQFIDAIMKNWHFDVDTKMGGGQTALYWAASNGHEDIIRQLIKHGAQVDAETNMGETALHKAALNGHEEAVTVLLQHTGDVNTKTEWGETPLYLAVSNGYNDIVQLLLNHDADASIQTEAGVTMLQQAVINQDESITQLLLTHNKGAEINMTNRVGETALYWAARTRNKEAVEQLIEKGANVNAVTEKGETALYWAARNNMERSLSLLIKNDADVNIKTEAGETALLWGVRNNCDEFSWELF